MSNKKTESTDLLKDYIKLMFDSVILSLQHIYYHKKKYTILISGIIIAYSIYLLSNAISVDVTKAEDEAEKERLRNKAQSVSNIKKIAVTQGGAPLTTKNIASVIGQVATTVTNRINQMAVTTTKQFLPIKVSIRKG